MVTGEAGARLAGTFSLRSPGKLGAGLRGLGRILAFALAWLGKASAPHLLLLFLLGRFQLVEQILVAGFHLLLHSHRPAFLFLLVVQLVLRLLQRLAQIGQLGEPADAFLGFNLEGLERLCPHQHFELQIFRPRLDLVEMRLENNPCVNVVAAVAVQFPVLHPHHRRLVLPALVPLVQERAAH